MADAGFALAQAFVRIRPTATGFRAEATGQIKSALAGVQGEIPLKADGDLAKAKITELRAYLDLLTKRAWAANIVADDKQATVAIQRIFGQLRALDTRTANPKISLEGIARAQAQMLGIDVNLDKIASTVAVAHIEVDDADAEGRLALLITQIAALARHVTQLQIGVTDPGAVSRIQALKELINTLSSESLGINFQDAEALQAIGLLEGRLREAVGDAEALKAGLRDAGGEARRVFSGGLFGTKIPLFGGFLPGILGTIGGFHLLVTTTVEFLAVLLPAITALGIFGAVGADTAQLLVQHFQTVSTVSRAMHLQLLPLGSDFARMEKAAQPQVYALLGDALQIAGQKAGILARLAREAGSVVDQLASRATLAIKSASFGQFLKDAAPDLQKLGTVAGNIFGAIGGLLKGVAGVAGHVLDFFVSFTHILENITTSPITQWLFRVTDAFHGLLVYGGLLGTGLVLLGRPLGAIAGLLGTTRIAAAENAGALGKSAAGWKTLAANVGLASPAIKTGEAAAKDAGVAAEDAATGTGLFGKALGALSGGFGWVGLAAAAVTVLVALAVHFGIFTSEADKLQANLSNAINASSSFGQVQRNTDIAIQKSSEVTGQLNQQYKQMVPTLQGVSSRFQGYTAMVHDNATAFQEVSGVHQHFLDLAVTEDNRLSQLSRLFGSTTIAQGLMNQAGIKASAIATDNKGKWQQDVQTLESLFSALKATADASGAAGQNEKILTYELSDQYTSVQKLNQGWDTFIGLVTSTQSAFDTAAQGLSTLNQTGGTINTTLGKLSVTTNYVKSKIDSLTPSGIALNQAFSQQVTNFNALIDTWRGAGLSLNAITGGVRAAIATLLPFAAGSQEATAQLAALAAEAGYAGPANFRVLQQWVGNVTGAEAILKQTSDEATLSQLALSGAFQSTGNAIAQHLINNINNATLAYDGVYKAATNYGQAIAKFGQNSAQTRQARLNLVTDIINAGVAAHQSQGQILALIEKVLQIPKSVALKLYMQAYGQYSVSGVTQAYNNAYTAHLQNLYRHGATGFRVPGFGGGDKFPAMLEGGETVVPKHLTPLVAPLMSAHGVPGFAQGFVNLGGIANAGTYAQSAYRATEITLVNASINALRGALFAAESASIRLLQSLGAAGIRLYDQGGYLPPGLSMAYNGTGRPEPVGGGGQEVVVRLEWVGSDTGLFSAFRQGIRARGGLQRALGP